MEEILKDGDKLLQIQIDYNKTYEEYSYSYK